MQKPQVVYVEGLPGGGKTTLINTVTLEQPELFVAVPEYLHAEQAINASRTGDQAYFLQNDEAKYRHARKADRIALVDRGHLSTLIYSRAYRLLKGQSLIDADAWYKNVILAQGMLPDLYVHLRISPSTTFARRPKTLAWDNVWDYEEALAYARQELTSLIRTHEQVPIVTIDTDTLTKAEVKALFLGHIIDHQTNQTSDRIKEKIA